MRPHHQKLLTQYSILHWHRNPLLPLKWSAPTPQLGQRTNPFSTASYHTMISISITHQCNYHQYGAGDTPLSTLITLHICGPVFSSSALFYPTRESTESSSSAELIKPYSCDEIPVYCVGVYRLLFCVNLKQQKIFRTVVFLVFNVGDNLQKNTQIINQP